MVAAAAAELATLRGRGVRTEPIIVRFGGWEKRPGGGGGGKRRGKIDKKHKQEKTSKTIGTRNEELMGGGGHTQKKTLVLVCTSITACGLFFFKKIHNRTPLSRSPFASLRCVLESQRLLSLGGGGDKIGKFMKQKT